MSGEEADARDLLHAASGNASRLNWFKLHTSSQGDEALSTHGCLNIRGVTDRLLRARIMDAILWLERSDLLRAQGPDTWEITAKGLRLGRSLSGYHEARYFWNFDTSGSAG